MSSDEVDDFRRRRRWFHLHALALGATFVLGGASLFLGDQRLAALAGAALAFSSIAAISCGSTLVTLTRRWVADGRDWFEDRPLRGEHLVSVVVLLVVGLVIAVLGIAGRLDIAIAWLS